MELLIWIATIELRRPARTETGALVTTDAERLGAMTRGAVGATALRFDGVDQQIIRLVEVDWLDDALVAVLTLRAVVTRTARGVRTTRLMAMIAREQGAVLVAEP